MAASEELATRVETLQNMLVSFSTNGGADDAEYSALRRQLIAIPSVRDRLPRFVLTCQNLGQFWAFIKCQYGTYAERRKYLWGEFAPLLSELEGLTRAPADERVSEALRQFDADHVHQVWERALDRRASDPDGAVTLARTLLETVLKHILDEANLAYEDNADLPSLYRLVAEQLQLAPQQQTERVLKQILGGATAVVEGIGALRNRMSDAHGKGQRAAWATQRHAELTVNLAGAVALFLVESWQEQRNVIPF